jgi:hypothetical protein
MGIFDILKLFKEEKDSDEGHESDRISLSEARDIWESNGRDEDYTFGYTENELLGQSEDFDVYDEDIFEVDWYCDNCNTYLNSQSTFDGNDDRHICEKCGLDNDTSVNNIR